MILELILWKKRYIKIFLKLYGYKQYKIRFIENFLYLRDQFNFLKKIHYPLNVIRFMYYKIIIYD